MGSAGDTVTEDALEALREKAEALGRALAARDAFVLTGGTTGLPHVVGKTAQAHGALHVGISPAANEREHVDVFHLPTEGCDLLVYTGFGLKGRNVVLVRSCDVVLFVRGSMGALNEFTIAHDEGKIIGCLTGTGGVADEALRLLETFSKRTSARVFYDHDAERLLGACIAALKETR